MTRTTQLITLFGAATLAMSLITAESAWAQGGGQKGAAAFDPLYPVVGAPLGTPYPTQYVDIARDPQDLPGDPLPNFGTIEITAHEVEGAFVSTKDREAAWAGDGSDVDFSFFAFGGGMTGTTDPKIPAPFLRVTEGNTVTIELENLGTETHAIDFHAVVGGKGGAAFLSAAPGQTASFTFVAANPGIYVYHCVGEGTPHGIAHHMNNGMFGLILVEPFDSGAANQFRMLTEDATEHYVFEQDIYRDPKTSDFDEAAMVETESPDFVVYNGRVGALIDHPLVAQQGRNAVIYHGVAGTHVASFHIIGEIFDWVFDHGDIISDPLENIQTMTIPSAGAAVLIMDGDELVPTDLSGGLGPELNILVDHASSKFRKGALGVMVVAAE